MTRRKTFSISSLRLYSHCPYAWYLKYVLRIPEGKMREYFHIGSAVHAGLAAYYSGYNPVEAFTKTFESDKNIIYLKESKEELRKIGLMIVEHYKEYAYHFGKPVGVEHKFSVIIAHPYTKALLPVPMIGVMDLVTEEGAIVDHKVMAGKMSQESADDDYQATAYWMAYEIITGKSPQYFAFNVLVKRKTMTKIEPPVKTYRDDVKKALFWEYANENLKKIENGNFEKAYNDCDNCPYKMTCN